MYFRMIVFVICAQLLGIMGTQNADAAPRWYDEIVAQRSRSAAMVSFLEAYARNPEAFDNATLASYQATLGTFNDAWFVLRDGLVQEAYFQACSSLFASATRRLEAADTLAELLERVGGTAADYPHPGPTGQAAHMEGGRLTYRRHGPQSCRDGHAC